MESITETGSAVYTIRKAQCADQQADSADDAHMEENMRPRVENAREKLLQTGKHLLKTKGYKKFSMPEAARLSGMATGTVYNYFENKDELIMQVVENDWNKVLDNINGYVGPDRSSYDNSRYIYEAVKEFEEDFKMSSMGLLSRSEELLRYEDKNLGKIYDVVGEKLEMEVKAGMIHLQVPPKKAAYIIVQLCMLAGRNPEISFDDIYSMLHMEDRDKK